MTEQIMGARSKIYENISDRSAGSWMSGVQRCTSRNVAMRGWDHSMRYGVSGTYCESKWQPERAVGITMLGARNMHMHGDRI